MSAALTRSALLRAGRSLAVLLVVLALTFGIFYLTPTDPALALCGKPCDPADLEAARAFMGFDAPWYVQFWTFLTGIVAGRQYGSGSVVVDCAAPCLGYSFQLHAPVTSLIAERFGVTASIAVGAVVLQTVVGVAAGALAARRRGGILDRLVTAVSVISASAPAFVVGLLALVVFALRNDWLPSGGYESLVEAGVGPWALHLILPWATLAFINGAIYARLVRSSMIEQLGLDYVRTARAAGLAERTIDGYALRSLALPVATLVALDMGVLLGGTVITERIFGLSGLGSLLLDATSTADLSIIVGTTLVGALLIVLANLVVDLVRPVLDPRLAAGAGRSRRADGASVDVPALPADALTASTASAPAVSDPTAPPASTAPTSRQENRS